MSLPAVLNEVISVTGVYSFPYDQTPSSPPTDQVDGVTGVIGPVLLFGNQVFLGGTGSASSGGGGGGGGGGAGGGGAGGGGAGGGLGGGGGGGAGTATTGFNANANLLAAGDFIIYANPNPASVNRAMLPPTSRLRPSTSRRSAGRLVSQTLPPAPPVPR